MLILLPNLLDERQNPKEVFSLEVHIMVESLQGLIAESEKAGRAYLRSFLPKEKANSLPLAIFNEHSKKEEIASLLKPLKNERWGLISDAGVPCVADPGVPLVHAAKEMNIQVVSPFIPSSFLLALMLSGLEGQRFAFHGYLPREDAQLKKALLQLEKRSRDDKATQIWIEAPYRSSKMLSYLLNTLHEETTLCIAKSLSSPDESVITQKIKKWRTSTPVLGKEPTIFLIYSG